MKILMVSLTSSPIPSPENKIFAPGIFCYNLAKGLQERGHEIKVYAADDSKKDEIKIEGLGLPSTQHFSDMDSELQAWRRSQHELFTLSAAFEEFSRGEFDLLHLNSFPVASYFCNFVSGPVCCTHHGAPDETNDLKTDIDKMRQKKYYKNMNFIAISNKQKIIGNEYFNYKTVIHHGIDLNDFKFNADSSSDLVFVGRVIDIKGTDIAIQSTINAGGKLKIYGVHNDNIYWKEKICPFIDGETIKYEGHKKFNEISEVYRRSKALLVPIDWDEPFGMVVIEAMACGTPVIAFNRGSMSDLIVDGVTGYLVDPGDLDGFVEAIKKIDKIDRRKCYEHVKNNFSIEKMVNSYEVFFEKLIAEFQKD